MTSERSLAAVLVELSDTLVDDFDTVEFLHRLCGYSVQLFDVGAAGVMLVDERRQLRVIAASSEEVEVLELFQIQRDQGPCLDSHRAGRPVLAHTPEELRRRWPAFGERLRHHFESVYALPLRLRGEALGALNLYGRTPNALDDEDALVGQALADIATISLLQERALREATVLSEQLQRALESRVVIEQAKGKLAERHAIDVGAAFERLRANARRQNAKLVDVARSVLDVGTEPGSG